MNLRVRINDELLLDAGTEEIGDSERIIHPPEVTLFHQVLAYLRGKPNPPAPLPRLTIENEGGAAAAVALRWGSYLAVLADREKPLWAEVRSPTTSLTLVGRTAMA